MALSDQSDAREALAGFDLHMQAGMPSHVILGGYESEQIIAHMKAAGWGPLPAPSDDERERREAASQAVVTSATQILGHSLNERGNSVARQYADAAIDAYLASRPTPPEDVAALIADRDRWKRWCAEETLAWVAATKRADEAEAALAARPLPETGGHGCDVCGSPDFILTTPGAIRLCPNHRSKP